MQRLKATLYDQYGRATTWYIKEDFSYTDTAFRGETENGQPLKIVGLGFGTYVVVEGEE